MTYIYDGAGQLTHTSYGTGNVTRDYSYDDLGRLITDTLTSPTGTPLRSDAYSYDNDDNRLARTVTPAGISNAGTTSYTYDLADRLTSWTNPAGSTTTYKYDTAGNRTKKNNVNSSYDNRNRLLSQGSISYTYNARGDINTTIGANNTTQQLFDAFDRMISDTSISTTYSYDALDRITTRNTTTFSYAGTEREPVADRTHTYSRTPNGDLLGFTTATTSREILTDAHHDVIATFTPNATSLSAQHNYDPYGKTLNITGTLPDIGYQSSWTDPDSNRVNMQSRWYGPLRSDFLSADTYNVPNKYSYGDGNPLAGTDPTGHFLGIPTPSLTKVLGDAAADFLSEVDPITWPVAVFVWVSRPTRLADSSCSASPRACAYPDYGPIRPPVTACGIYGCDPSWVNACAIYGCMGSPWPLTAPTVVDPGPSHRRGGAYPTTGSRYGGGGYRSGGYGSITPYLPPPPPWWISAKPTSPIPGSTWQPNPTPANPAGSSTITALPPTPGSGTIPVFHPDPCTSVCASINGAPGQQGAAPACLSNGDSAMQDCRPSDETEPPDKNLQPQLATDGAGANQGSGNLRTGSGPGKAANILGDAFRAPSIFRDRHGQLTNGTQTLDSAGMATHLTGSGSSGKSQFLFSVDADRAVLDAAAFADANKLWIGNKARVFVENGPVGIIGRNGQLTNWLSITRTDTGFVHGWPSGG